MIKPALLLIDIQSDFLQREGLTPPPQELIANIQHLLASLRDEEVPIVHIQTMVSADGSNRMPHWQRHDNWACVEGTAGCQPPAELLPLENEHVVAKQFFSAFDSPELHQLLSEKDIDTIVVAGLYTHGCVRATALDAYAKGYQVLVAADGIASTEPEHAALSQQWLEARAASFIPIARILEKLPSKQKSNRLPNVTSAPMAMIDGHPFTAENASVWHHHNPANHEDVLLQVPSADSATVAHAIDCVSQAQRNWQPSVEARETLLLAWASEMEKRRDEITYLMVLETGKPLMDAIEEFNRAIAHIKTTVNNLQEWLNWQNNSSAHLVRYCPVGTVALITPWNNPMAIPVGKIAPALAFGNGVLWKPALPTSRTTLLVLQCLLDAGPPASLIAVIFGDAHVARKIIRHPAVAAVSLTGSSQTGERVAQLCGQYNKALQAELGGNNAAIIMADADIDVAAQALAKSAFSFAGQRCTATRRIIVEASIHDEFIARLLTAVQAIRIGAPDHVTTQIGPLISAEQRDRVALAVEHALQQSDCQLLCGGAIPESWQQGYWYLPTVIETTNAESSIVQDETFGPVLVVQVANNFDEAIALCNNVKQGLAANIYTSNVELQQRFIASAHAGMLRINPAEFIIHPDAPFLGWKASGVGPPEHGLWDREFFSRTQVIYN